MNNALFKKMYAEALGTFTLIFIGAFAVAVTGTPNTNASVVVPALAHGLILVGLIFAYGHISGAHFNPAVTLAMLITGKQKPIESALYMLGQFLGSLVAAYALVLLLPTPYNYGVTKGILTDSNVWQAAGIEAILTFFLVSAIYQSAVHGKAGNLAPLAIGFTLVACILAGGVYTGASLNPARTLGPAIAAGDLSYVVPYFIGIFGGGALAGFVHRYILDK
jgi:MIP family channel proteins